MTPNLWMPPQERLILLPEEVRPAINVRVWRHRLRHGIIVDTQLHDEGHNLVVNTGLNYIRDRVRSNSITDPLSHIGLGTSNTAAAAGQTALVAEVFRDVYTQVTLGTASIVIRYYLGPNDANGETLQEAALFNAAAGGVMYARRVITAIVKTIDVASTFEWTLSWTAA